MPTQQEPISKEELLYRPQLTQRLEKLFVTLFRSHGKPSISFATLAQVLNLKQPSTIDDWLSEKQDPSLKQLIALARVVGCDENWLVHGVGQAYAPKELLPTEFFKFGFDWDGFQKAVKSLVSPYEIFVETAGTIGIPKKYEFLPTSIKIVMGQNSRMDGDVMFVRESTMVDGYLRRIDSFLLPWSVFNWQDDINTRNSLPLLPLICEILDTLTRQTMATSPFAKLIVTSYFKDISVLRDGSHHPLSAENGLRDAQFENGWWKDIWNVAKPITSRPGGWASWDKFVQELHSRMESHEKWREISKNINTYRKETLSGNHAKYLVPLALGPSLTVD